ncbi:cation transporter [Vibrio rumoiensis]|uniref:cation transporter n=1 Tax=Vibrio rumoiensis TaxID=76258 RepID=UPI000B5C6CF7|nr:cation transporter [Vibrio rumoiensis]
MTQYQLKLHGLNCMGCANKARSKLETLTNTQIASLTPTQANIQTSASLSDINHALSELGYRAEQVLNFELTGLNCGRCVAKVESALTDLSGIKKLEVTKHSLQVVGEVEAHEIIEAIHPLGYQANITQASSTQPEHPTAQKQRSEASESQPSEDKAIDTQPEIKMEGATALHFLISGMTCASCVSSVEKAIASHPQVHRAQVNLAEQTAWAYLEGQDCTEQESETLSAQIIEQVKTAGYQAERIQDDERMREQQQTQFSKTQKAHRNSAIAGIAIGGPLMLWGVFGGNMMINNPQSQWAWGMIGIICLALLTTAGKPFFINAWQALTHKRATMDTLVALGTGAAWLYSMLVVMAPSWFPEQARHVYFEASAMIIGLISLGHYIEAKAKARTTDALQGLINLQPKTATLYQDGEETQIAVKDIQTGMLVRVKPGERIPIDGVVVEGSSYLDEAMLTGEPIAALKQKDDKVFTGTINQDGSLLIKATMVGEQTTLARIIQLVRQAQSSKPALARLADQISSVFVPVVIMIAIIAAAVWYLFGPTPQASYMLVVVTTVLIIACPCALGLATPLSITVGVGKAAELGILIKDAEVLQTASQIQTIVFDKTGTLTQGKPTVQTIVNLLPDSTKLLHDIYKLESQSEHPLAQAVCRYIEQADANIKSVETKVEHYQTERGLGLQGKINGHQYWIGSPRYLEQNQVALSPHKEVLQQLEKNTETPILIAQDGKLVAIIGVSDPLRDESKQTVSQLQKMGIEVVLLSGDHPSVAQAIGKKLGIDKVIAGVLPDQKAQHISSLQHSDQGKRVVAMVGDGINDAPALAQADVGIAMGSGSDIAIENANMTLLKSSPLAVVHGIELSKATVKNIKQNLLGAFLYNSLGIPVAAGALYPVFGIMLSPVVAGAAMALSSITVVSNANRLRLFKPKQ